MSIDRAQPFVENPERCRVHRPVGPGAQRSLGSGGLWDLGFVRD